MRTWQRASRDLRCGAVSHCRIPEGEAYQVLSGDGWHKLRCQSHANEPMNLAQVTEFDARTPAEKDGDSSQLFKAPRQLAKMFDAKAAAAGERDK